MKIRNKRQSFELLQNGLLGNTLRTWNSLGEILKSNYTGTVSMRYKVGWGKFLHYNVSIAEISKIQRDWIKRGAKKEHIIFNESAPDEKLLIQGEFKFDIYSYYLLYSTEKKKMRDALKNGKYAESITAKTILEYYLDPSSFDDILALLELYPDHSIEFGTYSCKLGNIPNRNTIIWEVRYY